MGWGPSPTCSGLGLPCWDLSPTWLKTVIPVIAELLQVSSLLLTKIGDFWSRRSPQKPKPTFNGAVHWTPLGGLQCPLTLSLLGRGLIAPPQEPISHSWPSGPWALALAWENPFLPLLMHTTFTTANHLSELELSWEYMSDKDRHWWHQTVAQCIVNVRWIAVKEGQGQLLVAARQVACQNKQNGTPACLIVQLRICHKTGVLVLR